MNAYKPFTFVIFLLPSSLPPPYQRDTLKSHQKKERLQRSRTYFPTTTVLSLVLFAGKSQVSYDGSQVS